MFNFIKSKSRKISVLCMSALAVCALGICASAEDAVVTTSVDNSTVIADAGATLTTEFTNLVGSLVPVLIGIAVVGLGVFGVIYLFRMAKKFFSKAAG